MKQILAQYALGLEKTQWKKTRIESNVEWRDTKYTLGLFSLEKQRCLREGYGMGLYSSKRYIVVNMVLFYTISHSVENWNS